jgi:hypothetical protein
LKSPRRCLVPFFRFGFETAPFATREEPISGLLGEEKLTKRIIFSGPSIRNRCEILIKKKTSKLILRF